MIDEADVCSFLCCNTPIEFLQVSIQYRYYEIEGRVVDSTRLRAYDCQPLPDKYCTIFFNRFGVFLIHPYPGFKIAAVVIAASMEERFWREPSPSLLL